MSKEFSASRRSFMKGAGVVAAGALAASAFGCASKANTESPKTAQAEAASDVPAWLGTAPVIDESEINETLSADVVIAGAGNAGLAAAAYAAAQGVDFLLFDTAGDVPEARHWIGAVDTYITKENGITIDRAKFNGELSRFAGGAMNQQLIRMYMDESADMFEFIDSIMKANGQVAHLSSNAMPGGMGGTDYYIPAIEHMYNDANGGRADSKMHRNICLKNAIIDSGNEIKFNYKLIELEKDESGRVTGGIFETSSGYTRVKANKAVLLCTGGYTNNAQMLAALSPITAKTVVMTTSEPNNDGQGQKAAMWAGATRDIISATMIFDRGWVDPGTPAGFSNDKNDPGIPVWPSSIQINAASQPFLKVNTRGRRFMNESCDYDHISHASASQPNSTYFCIWDGNFGEDVNRFGTLGCAGLTPLMLAGYKKEDGSYDLDGFFELPIQGNGKVLKADTLEELADLMKLDDEGKKNFLATVERYNELYDNQEDTDFGKEAYRLSAIRKAPFYAASVGGRLLTTLDGISIDEDCRALDKDFNPIPGLYCAGDCSGGVFSGQYPDQFHGFAVGRSMTESIHAIKHIQQN